MKSKVLGGVMKNINDTTKIHKDKSKKVLKGPFYFLKWILKVELIILVLCFVIGTAWNSISNKTKFIIKYHIEKCFCFDIKNKNEAYEDIVQALQKNHYIQNEEKDFMCDILRKEIEENIHYIDMKETINRLKNLEVCYYKDNIEDKEVKLQSAKISSMHIDGKYNAFFNKMSLYEKRNKNEILKNYQEEKFDFASSDKLVYFHELNHLLTRNTFSTAMNTWARDLENKTLKLDFLQKISVSIQMISRNIFLETINEMFTREYFDEYFQKNAQIQENTNDLDNIDFSKNNAYQKDMVYAYALAEILPEETIRRYKFNDNESILISGLLEIDDNMNEVYKLITSIHSIKLYENAEEQQKENYKRIHDGYAYFYEKKYDKKMSDDLIMLLYFYGTPIQTEEERRKIREFLEMEPYDEITNIIPKGYVSKAYKQIHDTVEVQYTKDGKEEMMKIKNR